MKCGRGPLSALALPLLAIDPDNDQPDLVQRVDIVSPIQPMMGQLDRKQKTRALIRPIHRMLSGVVRGLGTASILEVEL